MLVIIGGTCYDVCEFVRIIQRMTYCAPSPQSIDRQGRRDIVEIARDEKVLLGIALVF